jgi:hypothetical protein
LASGSVRLPLPLGNGRFFLNPKAAKEDFLDGSWGFGFEPLVAFWKMRCFVLSVLPLAALRGSISISFIFG